MNRRVLSFTSLASTSFVGLLFFCVTLTGCSFDDTGLDARLCDTPAECPDGSDCVDGVCVSGDVDAPPDTGLPDATPDTDDPDTRPDGGPDRDTDTRTDIIPDCVSGERVCDGQIARVCRADGTFASTNCAVGDPCGAGGEGCLCDDGRCRARVCRTGQLRCSGSTIEICNDDGTAFVAAGACSDSEICISGVCQSTACEPGETRCSGDTLITCIGGGANDQQTPCGAAGRTCTETEDGARCVLRICEPGSAECTTNDDGAFVARQCSADGLSYTSEVVCDETDVCSDGMCTARICFPGVATCVDNGAYVACDASGGSTSIITCEDNEYCAEPVEGQARCVTQVCEPGVGSCIPGENRRQVCNPLGSGFLPTEACGDGRFCFAGECGDEQCIAGVQICEDPFTAARCNEDASVLEIEECAIDEFCAVQDGEARCLPQVCEPGTLSCSDDGRPERCNLAGGAFIPQPACPEDEACFEGRCETTVCEPSAATCVDVFTVGLCNEAGTSFDEEECPITEFCADGACQPQVCTPMERICADDDTVQVCNGAGSGVTFESCGAGDYCEAGTCTPQVCTPGESICLDEETREFCNVRGSAFVEETCGEDQACLDGDCVTAICEPETIRCATPTTVGTCNETGTGEELTPCDTDEACVDGACQSAICAPGTRTCADANTERLCDATGTAETLTPCATNERCASGQCRPLVCEASTQVCDGETRVICDETGTEVTTIPCGTDEFCTNGQCVAQVCQPGVATCANNSTVATCNARGSGFDNTSCGALQQCRDGACRDIICTPNARRCIDAFTVAVCGAFGLSESTEPCPEDTYCSGGSCLDMVCEPRARSCQDDATALTCNPTGSALVETACTEDEICRDGLCREIVCTPSETFCSGNTRRTCNADGTASTFVEACDAGCEDGTCVPPVCGDGIVQESIGEECDDQNDNPCDGCHECRINNVGNIVPNTRSAPGTTYVPGDDLFTIEAWLRITGPGMLLGIGDIPSGAPADHAALLVNSSGNLVFRIEIDGERILAVSPSSVSGTGWRHVAAVRHAERSLDLYIDGRLVATATDTGAGGDIQGTGDIFIGALTTPNILVPANAQIDDLRISTIARYETSYQPPRTTTTDADTLALYRFNEVGGNTVNDEVGTRHLTVTTFTRGANNCFGAPANSLVCGDGVRAPWEVCDDPESDACSESCDIVCNAIRGPTHNCYESVAVERSWDAAQAACGVLGGNLITIESAAENTWLRRRFGPTDRWIGLRAPTGDPIFAWISGSSASYRNWAAGQPIRAGMRDCAYWASGTQQWSTSVCSVPRASFCEF